VRQLAVPRSPQGSRTQPALVALVLSVLAGAVWQNFGQDILFVPSRLLSIVLSVSVPISFLLMGRKQGGASKLIRRGATLLSIAALPMLIANGMYLLSFKTADGAAGDIGGILIMLLGWAALVGTSIALAASSSSAQTRQAAR